MVILCGAQDGTRRQTFIQISKQLLGKLCLEAAMLVETSPNASKMTSTCTRSKVTLIWLVYLQLRGPKFYRISRPQYIVQVYT